MPIRVVEPPPVGTYGHVLRRYDRLPDLQIRFSGYDVNVKSRAVEMHGRVAATLFFPKGKHAAALRAAKQGWKDETEAWDAHLEGRPPPAPIGRKPEAASAVVEPPALGAKPSPSGAVRPSVEGLGSDLPPIARKRQQRDAVAG